MNDRKRKNWTAYDLNMTKQRYILKRHAGLGLVSSRIEAIGCLEAEKRYADSGIKTLAFPVSIRGMFKDAEEQFQYENNTKAANKEAPSPVSSEPPQQPQPVLEQIPSSQVVQLDDLPAEALFLMALRKMKEEISNEYNAKLVQLMDMLTAPEAVRDESQNVLLEMITPKQRLPKVCIVGLLPSQYHIVSSKLSHILRIVNFAPEETGSAAMQASLKNCDLAVTMTNFISHSTDAVARKHAKRWMPYTGGITNLIALLEKTVI